MQRLCKRWDFEAKAPSKNVTALSEDQTYHKTLLRRHRVLITTDSLGSTSTKCNDMLLTETSSNLQKYENIRTLSNLHMFENLILRTIKYLFYLRAFLPSPLFSFVSLTASIISSTLSWILSGIDFLLSFQALVRLSCNKYRSSNTPR